MNGADASLEDDTTAATRRAVLSGVATLGLTSLAATTSTARTDGSRPTESSDPTGSAFGSPDELETFVDDLMADRIGTTVPGATIAVVEGETPVLTKGYGYADAETETPVRADETAFRIGSVGKLVTWTAVMQGVERGTLALDDDVDAYLGDSPVEIPATYDAPVTLRHLGTHTAGFESVGSPGLVDDPTNLTSIETALVERRPARVRPPGEAVAYSNYGAMLAGHIIAEAHDTTFDEFVQTEILDPLGMDHTTFAQPVPEDHPGELASPHATDGDGFTVSDPIYINFRPAGSTTATATDMARFMSAHLANGAVGDVRILQPRTVEEMHSRQFVRHPAVNNWRYGFYEYGPPNAGLFGHSGGSGYYTSYLLLAPANDVGIFVNYNVRTGASPSTVVDAIVDEYELGSEASAPAPTTGPAVERRAQQVAGEYRNTAIPRDAPLSVLGLMAHRTVTATDDGRIVTKTLGGQHEWVETAPYVYHAVDGTDVAAFEVEDGDVRALHLNSSQQGTFVPVDQFGDRQVVAGGVLGGSLVGFAGSLLGYGGLGAWRFWRGRRGGKDDSAAVEPESTSETARDEEGFA